MSDTTPNPAPAYRIDEGSITLPPAFQDRSNNIFVVADKLDTLPNLSIARDTLQAGEDIPAYVTRQIALLKRKMAGHKVEQRAASWLGSGDEAIEGEAIQAHYRSGTTTVYQRQAAFALPSAAQPLRVLIFTASSPKPFIATFDTLWQDWLESFVPRRDGDDQP